MRIILNGKTEDCPDGATLEQILERYKFDKNRVAAELNSQVIPKSDFPHSVLKDQDVLEVVTFVGGG